MPFWPIFWVNPKFLPMPFWPTFWVNPKLIPMPCLPQHTQHSTTQHNTAQHTHKCSSFCVAMGWTEGVCVFFASVLAVCVNTPQPPPSLYPLLPGHEKNCGGLPGCARDGGVRTLWALDQLVVLTKGLVPKGGWLTPCSKHTLLANSCAPATQRVLQLTASSPWY